MQPSADSAQAQSISPVNNGAIELALQQILQVVHSSVRQRTPALFT